jgi:hypothetical protein
MTREAKKRKRAIWGTIYGSSMSGVAGAEADHAGADEEMVADLSSSLASASMDESPSDDYCDPEIEARVYAKMYYAGSSARYMFGFSTTAVKDEIDEYVKNIHDATSIFTGGSGENLRSL